MSPIADNDDAPMLSPIDAEQLLARLQAIVAGDVVDLVDQREAG